MRPAWTTEIISVSGSVYSVNKVTDFAKFMKGWLIFQLKWFQIHAFVNLFIFLHCICMVILEPFQFSDSKKGFWQKLKRNVWSRSQNLILVPVECFRQDIHQSQSCNEASKIFDLRRFLSEDPSSYSSSVHFQMSKNLWSFEDLLPKNPKIFGKILHYFVKKIVQQIPKNIFIAWKFVTIISII